jgi:hypothetical protein
MVYEHASLVLSYLGFAFDWNGVSRGDANARLIEAVQELGEGIFVDGSVCIDKYDM